MEPKTAIPPYPSAARISDSQCYPQYSASLKFIIFRELQAWNSLAQRRVNVKSILTFTRNARKRRGKRGWNITKPGPCSHENIHKYVLRLEPGNKSV